MGKDPARAPKIEWLPISEIPRNPRQHSARQINEITRSIETFDNLVPILIDRDNKILAGHGRVLALKRLGRTEALVIRAVHPYARKGAGLQHRRQSSYRTLDLG